jgi:hypothetical protein
MLSSCLHLSSGPSFRVSYQNPVRTLVRSNMCYMPCPPHPRLDRCIKMERKQGYKNTEAWKLLFSYTAYSSALKTEVDFLRNVGLSPNYTALHPTETVIRNSNSTYRSQYTPKIFGRFYFSIRRLGTEFWGFGQSYCPLVAYPKKLRSL